MDIFLQQATLKNLEEILKIEISANSKTYFAMTTEDEIRDYINNNFVFLIKNKEITIGAISFKVIEEKTANCDGLIILPEYRGNGFAKEAMKLLLEKINKYSRIELVVHPHNNPAIILYLSLDFIIEAWKDNYFGNDEPRLMMIRKY